MAAVLDREPPDSPLSRAIIQCSDPEATAWAWAAGIHLGLPPKIIIQHDEYDGAGRDIRQGLSINCYPGFTDLPTLDFAPRGVTLQQLLIRHEMWQQPKLIRWPGRNKRPWIQSEVRQLVVPFTHWCDSALAHTSVGVAISEATALC